MWLNAVILLLCLFVSAGPAQAPPAPKLAVNAWTLLPAKREVSYTFSAPIYVPGRAQILHWGFMQGSKVRNEVLALDAPSSQWTSAIGKQEQWVYSFAKNAWAPLPVEPMAANLASAFPMHCSFTPRNTASW
jgi:hypothetical protein